MDGGIDGFVVLSGGFPTGDAPLVTLVGFCIGGAVAVGKPVMVWPKVAGGSQKGCMKLLLKVDTKWSV